MKKNRFIIICLVIAAIGIGIASIGFLLGGRVYGFSLGKNGVMVNEGIDNTKYIHEKKDLESFKSLDLKAGFADVTIVESDYFGIEYNVRQDCPITETRSGDKLIIEQKHQQGSITLLSFATIHSAKNPGSYINIYVPAGTEFESVVFNVESGDIKFGTLKAEQIDLNDSFGDVDVDQIEGKTTNVVMESGSLFVTEINTDSFTCENHFGDIEIGTLNAKKNEITLKSGNVTMDKVNGQDMTMNDSFGDVKISDMTLTGKYISDMDSGMTELGKVIANSMDIIASFGDVKGDDITTDNLNFKIDSGDCTVKCLSGKNIKIDDAFGSVELGMKDDADSYYTKAETKFGTVSVNEEEMGTKYVNKAASTEKVLEVFCDSGDVSINNAR